MDDSKILNGMENLRKIRTSKKITQLKLSMNLGISQELVSRYELGSSYPPPSMLIKLSDYFGCSTDFLLGRTTVPTPIKYLASDNEKLKESELYQKYCSLSKEDKKCFDRFLEFLSNDNNIK